MYKNILYFDFEINLCSANLHYSKKLKKCHFHSQNFAKWDFTRRLPERVHIIWSII